MAVSFLAERAYRPRHAAPPGLFWRSLLSRKKPAAADEQPRRQPESAMTRAARSESLPAEPAQSRTSGRRPWQ